MAHKVCHDVGTWVDQNVNQPLQRCVEQDCNWWCLCCNKWFCFIVWVIVVVTTWVVQTVCEIVADVVELVVNVVRGIVDIVAGIFTWDGTRVLAGLGEIVGGVVLFGTELIPIVTGGTLVGAFTTAGESWALRDFVRDLINAQFPPNSLAAGTGRAILDALGVDGGGFGFRLRCTAMRMLLRSDFSSPENNGVPDLIVFLRQNTNLDLKSLAGFNPPAWWSRNWPELVGDSGNVSDADLDNYVAAGGVGDGIKQFTLFSMSNSDLQSRLDTATDHAMDLGLILQWDIQDVRVAQADQILINHDNFAPLLSPPPFFRHTSDNMALAQGDLCKPMTIAAFSLSDSTGAENLHFNGISAHLANSTCLEPDPIDGHTTFNGEGVTGTAFRYRKPDKFFKYVTIHELGHTFGLCHVDGFLRIMFSTDNSKFNLGSLFQFWTSGLEAGFTLDEAKNVWRYIVANFSVDCLSTRQF